MGKLSDAVRAAWGSDNRLVEEEIERRVIATYEKAWAEVYPDLLKRYGRKSTEALRTYLDIQQKRVSHGQAE